MEHKKKTLIWEDNSEPPKDYIWIKADGKAYEFDYLTRTWVESKTIKSASGSEGGSTEGAITYNEQELTESQQMQARKNLDLYYEETITEKTTIDWDGDTSGKEDIVIGFLPRLYQVSEETPAKENIVAYLDGEGNEVSCETIQSGDNYNYYIITPINGGIFGGIGVVVFADYNGGVNEVNASKGIYLIASGVSGIVYNAETTIIHQIPQKFLSESDAVQYVEQELTDAQKIQARKNQGLYYEEETVERLESGDGEYAFLDSHQIVGARKVSDKVIDPNSLIGQKYLYDDMLNDDPAEYVEHTITTEMIKNHSTYGYTSILVNVNNSDVNVNWAIVLTGQGGAMLEGESVYLSQGVWLVDHCFWVDVPTVEISQIPPKYIKDMYYEESGTGEKTVESIAAEYPAPAFAYDSIGFYKAASDTPAIADIKKVNNITIEDGDLTAENEGDYTIYTPSGATETQGKFIVVYENTTIDSYDVEPGLYYPGDGIIFARPYLTSVTYIGDISTVHQIPAKYIPNIPSGGAPAVKIEIPSMGDDVYYNMGILNVNQYVPSRDVVFSVEGYTVVHAYAFDVINGGTNGQEGDTLTFSSGGLYWVQLELAAGSTYSYVCAMIYVESDNQ